MLEAFEIKQRLGEGGMGAVYEARHTGTGHPVAVKVIRGIAGEQLERRFRREVQAHARLCHPGIVYLFEYGSIDYVGDAAEIEEAAEDEELAEGGQFIAMELATGSLRDRLPLTGWESCKDVLVQVLEALAFAHAHDVVHRDLKPENLLMFPGDAGERVKLADFGIAHVLEVEVGEETGWLQTPVGSPNYMPSEQIRGQWRQFGPWTDIYALGCIAFELVCGRPPFKGRSFADLLMLHILAPRPELKPRFAVPDSLQEWIHCAMAVDPGDRFRCAADALRALQTCEARPAATEAVSEQAEDLLYVDTVADSMQLTAVDTPGSVHDSGNLRYVDHGTESAPDLATSTRWRHSAALTLPSTWRRPATDRHSAPLVGAGLGLFGLRVAPFVGREVVRNQLWEELRQVVEEDSFRLTVVAGEAGLGKSRLAHWLAGRAHEVGAATVLSAFHTAEGNPGDGLAMMVAGALRTWRLPEDELLEHLRGELPRLRGEADAAFNDDVESLARIVRPHARGGGESDTSGRFLTPQERCAVLARLLCRLSQERPLLVWLDDVQWAPDGLALLEHLAENADRLNRILIVATVRSDLLAGSSIASQRLAEISRSGCASWLDLPILSEGDHRKMIEQLLPLAPTLQDILIERSEGNPLFSVQLLSHWVDRDALEIAAAGFDLPPGHGEIPDSIHALWINRLRDAIGQGDARAINARWEALELAAALGRMVDDEEWRSAGEDLGLENPDALLDTLVTRGLVESGESGWRFTHVLIVDSLKRRALEEGRWARHNERCVDALARLYGATSGDMAGRLAHHLVEAGRLEEALTPMRAHVHREYERGDDGRHLLALERQLDIIEQLQLSSGHPRRLQHEVHRSLRDFYAGETNLAQNRAAGVFHVLADCEPTEEKVWAAKLVGMCERRRGNLKTAQDWLDCAGQFAQELCLPWQLADTFREQGALFTMSGDFERSQNCLEQAIRFAGEVDDDHALYWTKAYIAWLLFTRGRDDAALQSYQQCASVGRDRRFQTLEAYSLTGQAMIARMRGEFEEAREILQATVPLRRPRGMDDLLLHLETLSLEVSDPAGGELKTLMAQAGARISSMHAFRYQPWLDLIGLADAARRRDLDGFELLRRPYLDGWPSGMSVTREHPWHLQLVARYLGEKHGDLRGWAEGLAGELYQRLGIARESVLA